TGELGIRCTTTCEPSDGPIGNLIRQVFKGRIKMPAGENKNINSGDLFDEQMAYLFAADRHDHLYNDIDGIFSILNKGISVICTRYYFSSLAYHCSNESDFIFVQELNKNFPQPDLIVYLDNPVEVSIKRMESRKFKDSYENHKKLTQAKENYKKAISNYKGNILIVTATEPQENIKTAIKEKIIELFNE
ncbi:dTMP kinase, partial [Pseudomonas umsongensis]|uniref:dTMP kinase n=1 Tax=Pseudomonas umsongensis TaxID=198618 RepID=UPI002009F015